MSTALTKIETKLQQLDKFAEANSLSLLTDDKGAFSKAIAVANAMTQLRSMIDDEVLDAFMPLQGSALGFKTDKDATGGYKKDVVKEVMIEATLKGAQLVGNQVNILAGRFYATLQFFEHYFRVIAKNHVTDLRLDPGVPKITAEGAIVHYKASWKLKGVADSLERDFPVKVNSGMGPDAILGKAKRKVLAAVYERVTGTVITDGDVQDANTVSEVQAIPVEAVPALDDSTVQLLNEALSEHADKVNAYLQSLRWISEGQTYVDVSPSHATTILGKVASFLAKAGVSS